MKDTVSLYPLQCPHCQAAITAQPDEILWRCPDCQQAFTFSQRGEINPIQIFYLQKPENIPFGLPYWRVAASVTFPHELMHLKPFEERQNFWQNPLIFLLPAYKMSLNTRIERCIELLSSPPLLIKGQWYDFAKVTLAVDDLQAYIELVVLQLEAEYWDDLQQITFDLQLRETQLWIFAE